MKYLKIFFNFISFLSIFYLIYILFDDLREVNFLNSTFLIAFIQSVFFSTLAYILIFICFLELCRMYRKDILFPQVFKLMSISQLYKYIPGNFFHYLKRYEFFTRG